MNYLAEGGTYRPLTDREANNGLMSGQLYVCNHEHVNLPEENAKIYHYTFTTRRNI